MYINNNYSIINNINLINLIINFNLYVIIITKLIKSIKLTISINYVSYNMFHICSIRY